MERIKSETVHEGPMVKVRHDTFRGPDGDEREREIVEHPGAVGILAYDDEHVYLVRQPREPVGVDDLLELPAGKLDEEGETPLECAQARAEGRGRPHRGELARAEALLHEPGLRRRGGLDLRGDRT